MPPKTIIAANWKMNKTLSQAKEFMISLVETHCNASLREKDREIVICAPFTVLFAIKEFGFKIGAQNMHWEDSGAYTGEISPLILKDIGCQYVIIGHSERRQYFGETDETVNKKIKAALKHKLIPIFCVGETLAQRQKNQTNKVVTEQIKKGLKNIKYNAKNLVIAYEPVWAIGTGKVATPEQAQEVHKLIHKLTNKNISVLYGGSVKPENIKDLMAQPDINGALVGGASLEAESFAKIINY